MKVLMFHEIVERKNEFTGWNIDTNGKYSVSLHVFENFVSCFKNQVIYTFDDGGKSNLKASKILEKYECKGVFFVVTSRIGSPGFLDKNDVEELAKNHNVYSHSHNHMMIPQSPYDLKMDYSTSFQFLKSFNLITQNIISLPGGTITLAYIKEFNDLGVKTIYHSAPSNFAIRILNRYDIEFIPRVVMNERLCQISLAKSKLASSRIIGLKSYLKQLIYAYVK